MNQKQIQKLGKLISAAEIFKNYISLDQKTVLNQTFEAIFGQNQPFLVTDYISKNLLLSSSPLKLDLNGENFCVRFTKAMTIIF